MQSDREAGGGARDPGNRPSLREESQPPRETLQRKLVQVTRHQIVPHVECRKRAGGAEVERVERVGNARTLIDRLTEGVSSRKIEAFPRMPEARLEGVIVRVADTGVK